MYSRILAAAIVCAYVHPAYAEPTPEDLKKASALFDEAEKKFKIGEYQLALADYKSAYLLTGEPALLFNIGQCHRFLGNDQEAIKSYKNFLRDANPEGSQRTTAEKLIAELENKIPAEQKATLEAKAPSGADGAIFFIDGTAIGPLPLSTVIATGRHNVELRRENVILYSETVEMKPGETRSISVSLSNKPKEEGVLLRFSTPLADRAFDVELISDTQKGLTCPAPVTVNAPCELRIPSPEKTKVKIGNCSDPGVFCSSFITPPLSPSTDSNMSLTTPQAPRFGRTLIFTGAPVGVVGLIFRLSSPFDPFAPPVNPNNPGAPQPGEKAFKTGGALIAVGAISTVVGASLTLARKHAIKKYYQTNPIFVPVTPAP